MVSAVLLKGKSGNALMWNLSADVGVGKPNHADDVEFVRFGYFLMKTNPTSQPFLTQQERSALAKLRVSGGFGDDLALCIREHEVSRGGTQDGFVSPMKNVQVTQGSYDPKHRWIVHVLNVKMIQMTSTFPRIDLHELSGPSITESVAKICNFK